MARPAPQTLVIMALVVLLLLQGVQAQESAAATAPAGAKARDLITLDALMPPLKTEREDEYLCTAVQLPAEDLKLVTVEALADQGTVHHMLLFGETGGLSFFVYLHCRSISFSMRCYWYWSVPFKENK